MELERAIAELEAAVGLEDEAESAAGMSAPEEPSHLAAVEDVAPEDVAPSIDDLDWEAPIGRAVDGEPPLSNPRLTQMLILLRNTLKRFPLAPPK